jgi:hypothetical protein
MDNRTIDGYVFKHDEDAGSFECRGDICYDDEHDECPEPGLWVAGMKLEKELREEGYTAEVEAGEKGWVEVYFTKKD